MQLIYSLITTGLAFLTLGFARVVFEEWESLDIVIRVLSIFGIILSIITVSVAIAGYIMDACEIAVAVRCTWSILFLFGLMSLRDYSSLIFGYSVAELGVLSLMTCLLITKRKWSEN